jgi:uncharacterized LabA/DUF88 family protein
MSDTNATARLAILIDAENASHRDVLNVLVEVSRYGIATVKRAYGDWTKPGLLAWRDVLLEHSIRPMQQFAHTSGKNASDSALIIDAMDLLHARQLDGFCIVTSDSDFTGLVQRVRESGLLVLGFGERKTPAALVSACDRFVYTDLLAPDPSGSTVRESASPPQDSDLSALLRGAVRLSSGEDGWANLSAVKTNVLKLRPGFDQRMWRRDKFSDLVRDTGLFVFQERGPDGQAKSLYIREAQSPKA